MSANGTPRLESGGESPRLAGSVNLETVSQLVDAADGLFEDSGDSCRIDLASLEKSDSATVALLLEWKRRAQARGCTLSYSNLPQNLLDIARISQLESLLSE